MSVGGFNTQAEKLNGLSGRGERNARVCEHHKSQCDQDGSNDVFQSHMNGVNIRKMRQLRAPRHGVYPYRLGTRIGGKLAGPARTARRIRNMSRYDRR